MKTDWHECLRPNADDDAGNLCISLNTRGDIAMNYGTWVELGSSWFVVLLFDPGSRRIGIKPVKPGTRNAFRVCTVGQSGGRVVRAGRLIKQFGIEIKQTIRFREPHFASGIWVLDLESAFVPGKVARHWRRKSVSRSLTVREG